ncbi:hypothetical protein [Piscinibacter koreensis]|uniref:Uncharacterized protein n=1 Tax=Piscinibacter koreensis TaxID=2742824 RepID=A0A7Y6NQV7_9BURK|nr:hypothetical protein [Schlegelella koreensis]NUZ07675.1 hypothetical protein [Schlegelella koreensis]
MAELRASYSQQCADDEARARHRYTELQGAKRVELMQQERAQKSEQDRQRLAQEQCDEMYRIVALKRKKVPEMNSGERADFERFQENWRSRCPGAR